ncbi:unnamed protein product [Ectocarpus fasciculatus]
MRARLIQNKASPPDVIADSRCFARGVSLNRVGPCLPVLPLGRSAEREGGVAKHASDRHTTRAKSLCIPGEPSGAFVAPVHQGSDDDARTAACKKPPTSTDQCHCR